MAAAQRLQRMSAAERAALASRLFREPPIFFSDAAARHAAWRHSHDGQARYEGWTLSQCAETDGGWTTKIQKRDEDPVVFRTNGDAAFHVACEAVLTGGAAHVQAIEALPCSEIERLKFFTPLGKLYQCEDF